jgi:hypothetical protein
MEMGFFGVGDAPMGRGKIGDTQLVVDARCAVTLEVGPVVAGLPQARLW